jgi:hypothetical protein
VNNFKQLRGYAMHTRRFGKKIKLPSTIAIKHQLRALMREDLMREDLAQEDLAREGLAREDLAQEDLAGEGSAAEDKARAEAIRRSLAETVPHQRAP